MLFMLHRASRSPSTSRPLPDLLQLAGTTGAGFFEHVAAGGQAVRSHWLVFGIIMLGAFDRQASSCALAASMNTAPA